MIGRAGKAIAQLTEGGRDPLSAFVTDEVTKELVARVAKERGWAASVQAGGVSAAARALAVLDPPRILIVDISDSEDAVADVQAINGMLQSETRVIVLGTTNDVEFFRDLVAVGASDYLLKPVAQDALKSAITRAELANEGANRHHGKLIYFIGVRGGVGASTLLTSCAWITANEFRRSSMLVDLDLQFGTVALSLDLDPTGGLREALSDPDRMDDLFLDRATVRAGDHLAVLGGEEPLDDLVSIEPGAISRLMDSLRDKYDFIFADLPARLAVLQPDALAGAEETVLVCDLTLASLRDVNRMLRFLKAGDFEGRVSLVANLVGSGKKGQLTQSEFEKGLETKIGFFVPFDDRSAAKAANYGQPLNLVGRSATKSALMGVTAALTGASAAKRSFLRLRKK